jgi:hypothetical protein
MVQGMSRLAATLAYGRRLSCASRCNDAVPLFAYRTRSKVMCGTPISMSAQHSRVWCDPKNRHNGCLYDTEDPLTPIDVKAVAAAGREHRWKLPCQEAASSQLNDRSAEERKPPAVAGVCLPPGSARPIESRACRRAADEHSSSPFTLTSALDGQLPSGRSAESMTSMSIGAVSASSLRPSCSCSAVNSDGASAAVGVSGAGRSGA